MELYEHRVVNGLMKSGVATPELAARLLTRDVELYVDPTRARELLPAAWALTTVLRRQFFGAVTVHGIDSTHEVPLALDRLAGHAQRTDLPPLSIGIGTQPPHETAAISVWGDVRGSLISFGSAASGTSLAHPVAAFALAGYLGFATLAAAIGLDPFRESSARTTLALPLPESSGYQLRSLAVLGLGQLGQAYLSLLHFLYPDPSSRPQVVLVDYQRFGSENLATQILLDPKGEDLWVGQKKANYLADVLRGLDWRVETADIELDWHTPPLPDHPQVGLIGFDSLEARRKAVSWRFAWLFESGVGMSLAQPRITWSSIPPDKKLAKSLYQDSASSNSPDESEFVRSLRRTPGQCGWIAFRGVAASAPSLGLVAAAFTVAELLRWNSGERAPVRGVAHLWSPLLPYLRQHL